MLQPANRAPAHPLLRAPALWALLAGGLVFVAFTPALGGTFLTWDDAGYVVDNPRVHELSWATVRWAFTEFCCNYWAPLTWLSLALDHALWGLDPWGYHLTNHLLHALNTGLLLAVAHRLLACAAGRPGEQGAAPPSWALAGALLVALGWGLHPMRVESVAWVAERKDVLSTAFGLLAARAWLAHAAPRTPRPAGAWWRFLRSPAYLASAGWLTLSLLAKPGLVALPVALLVLDWYPLRRPPREPWWALLAEKLPLLALAGAAARVAIAASAPSVRTLGEVDLASRALLAGRAASSYLWQTLAPLDLSPVYFHPGRIAVRADEAAGLLAAVAITAGALLLARRRPAVTSAWLFFLLVIGPSLGIFLNGPQWLAPRFTYVPGMGLAVLAGGAAASRLAEVSPGARRAGTAAAALVLLALALVSVRDQGHWRSDVALWTAVVAHEPRSGQAHKELGAALTDAGRYPEAIAALDRAVELDDPRLRTDLHLVLALRAGLHWTLGDGPAAAADLRRAAAAVGEPLRREYLRQVRLVLGEEGRGSGPAPAPPPGQRPADR